MPSSNQEREKCEALLTPDEVCTVLKISTAKFYRLVTSGRLPAVKIGSNCWFGVNCVVTSGVTIGDRCVIGSNSVVTRDLPPGAVAAGAPARIIREIDFRRAADLRNEEGVRP